MNRLRRPDKNSARGAFAARLEAALGKYDPHEVIKSIAENEAFSQKVLQVLNDPSLRKKYFGNQAEGRKFTPESLEKAIPFVLKCCREFVGGAPSFVCKQPQLCKFCGDSRARSFYRFYLRMAFGRLTNSAQFNAMHGVIRHPETTWPLLPSAMTDLQMVVSDVRRRMREEFCRAKGGWKHAQIYDLYQFDAFMHIGVRYNAYGEAMFFPHVHVVAQLGYPRSSPGILIQKLHAYSQNYGCKFAHTGTMKVRNSPNATAKKTKWDFATLGWYDSRMFKLDKMRPNYIRPLQRLSSIATFSSGFQQVTRRMDGQRIGSLFANTLPNGDAQVELPIGSKFWT